MVKFVKSSALLLMAACLSACATLENAVQAPVVTLQGVDLADLDFSGQSFVLSFGVSNPNAFSLPINHVSYGLKLDEQHFASGQTAADFSIPANGNGEFAISVELDLLRTAPQLLYTVRDAASRDLPYELKGELGVDLPLIAQLPFKKSGAIRLQSRFVTRATKNESAQTP